MAAFPLRAAVSIAMLCPANILKAQGPAGQKTDSSTARPHAAVAEEKTTEERLGPFPISGNKFAVVLHKKHLAASEDGQAESADGVVAMEIVDAAGTVPY